MGNQIGLSSFGNLGVGFGDFSSPNVATVDSVFGRTGNVTPQNGDYNTDEIIEGVNLYYTNSRGINSILDGYVSSFGLITSSDTILTAIQKLNGNVNSIPFINGLGFVKSNGTSLSYDNSTYTPTSRTLTTTAPLQGGGDLSANRTLSITQANTSTSGFLSNTDWNLFNAKYNLPALTSGSVLFSDGTTIAQDNANLF